MNKKRNFKKTIYILIPIVILVFMCVSFSESLTTHFSPILNRIGKKHIMKSIKDYDSLETTHFTIRYKEGNIDDAIVTAKIAEKYYEDVTNMYNHKPKDKVQMIIYDSTEKMLKNTNLEGDEPPIGVYYSGVIHILEPDKWIDDKENIYNIYEKEGPVVHEFTHLIVDEITKGNYPLWLTEGLALYTEYSMTGFEIGPPFEEEEDMTIKTLSDNFRNLNQQLAYRKSFDIVRDVSNEQGFEKVNTMLNKLGEGRKVNTTMKSVLKIKETN